MLKSSYKIGQRIKQLRKERGMSQAILAERIQRDQSTVAKIESGRIELTPSVMRAISNIFGVREGWLLTGKGPKYIEKNILIEQMEEKIKELGEGAWYLFITMKAAYMLREEAKNEILLDKKSKLQDYDFLSDVLTDPKFFKIVKKLFRIYSEGDEVKLSAIKSQLNALDPGAKVKAPSIKKTSK